jgi:hypothetical protein
MRILTVILIGLIVVLPLQYASAQEIPAWIKNNAKWWADGTIADSDFVQGIQYLVSQKIIKIPETTQEKSTPGNIPAWIKNNAKWWADGTISDNEFVQGIQFLIRDGIIAIESKQQATQAITYEDELKRCQERPNQREQLQCEREIKTKHEIEQFKTIAVKHQVGPITFYYAGATVEQSAKSDVVNLRFLVENTGSKDNVTLFCTGPAACNYDVSDGQTTYKYSSQDFTSGQIVLKPGQSKFINMLFGPAIGYGSYVDFVFDPQKQYTFNVKEPWGSAAIPLNLK